MKTNYSLLCALLVLLFALQTNTFAQKGRIMVQQDRIWTYADLSGKPVVEGQKRWKIYPFDPSGVALINNRGFQIIDADGNQIKTNPESFKTPTGFLGTGTTFSEGYLRIDLNRKWGMMNNKGEMVIEAIYDKISSVNNGYAIASKDGEYFTLSPGGEVNKVEHPGIRNFSHFQEGLAPIQTEENGWGYINTAGKVVIEPQFASVGYFSDGLAWAKTHDKTVGFINKTGSWAIDPIFQAAKEMDPESNLALVRVNDKWQYCNPSGDLMAYDQYERLYSFSEGLAVAKVEGDKVGYIAPDGSWAIEPKYTAGHAFVNGMARVQQDEKWGIINRSGEWIIEPTFDALKDPVIFK